MKVLILATEECDYDYSSKTINDVVLIPDDLTEATIRQEETAFYLSLNSNPAFRHTKRGHLHQHDRSKACAAWAEHMRAKYAGGPKVEFIEYLS